MKQANALATKEAFDNNTVIIMSACLEPVKDKKPWERKIKTELNDFLNKRINTDPLFYSIDLFN